MAGVRRVLGLIFIITLVLVALPTFIGRAMPLHALVYDYIQNADVGIFVYDVRTGVSATFIDDARDWESHPVWSPDGTQMAYIGGINPGRMRIWQDGRSDTVYLDQMNMLGASTVFFWSGDGTQLMWITSGGAVVGINVETGAPSMREVPGTVFVSTTNFTPLSEREVLLIAGEPRGESPGVRVFDLDSGALGEAGIPDLTCETGVPHEVTRSADGTMFALSCGMERSLYLVSAASGERRLLVGRERLPGGVRTHVRFSPDGESLLFSYLPDDGNVRRAMVVDVTTGALRPVLGTRVPLHTDWLPPGAFDGR
ncbi:MAG: WD40 repeat domain-containing protein [Chloroflexota bacterium]